MMYNKPIGFATGSIWRWGKSYNRNDLIAPFRELEINAVELTIGSTHELFELEIAPINLEWMQGLDFVSIHAPALNSGRTELAFLEAQLQKLAELTRLLQAAQVVIHAEDLPPADLLMRYPLPLSVENLNVNQYRNHNFLKEIFNRNHAFSFCLDCAHAFLISEKETEKLISLFGDRISHIHVSGVHDGKDHESLIDVSSAFLRSVEVLKELLVPVIIEEDIRMVDQNQLFIETDAAKKIFYSGMF